MANWTLVGELGAGKSVLAVGKIRDQLLAGLPCAGNMDIWPEHFLPSENRAIYLRLPDFPSSDDLWALGVASDSKRESTFGLVVLDELAIFLNSRQWQSKGRDYVISFLRLIRKRHWHTLFIAQDIESLDKQARNGIVEHKVQCKRTDRLSIPVFGVLMRVIGLAGRFPQIHLGVVRYGKAEHSPVVQTWRYWGKNLYEAYNTDQHYSDEEERDVDLTGYEFVQDEKTGKPIKKEKLYPASIIGTYSQLSAWHLRGRYLTWWDKHGFRVKALLRVFAVVGLIASFFISNGHELIAKARQSSVAHAISDEAPLPASGVMRTDTAIYLTADGQVHEVYATQDLPDKTLYRANGKWYEITQSQP